MEFDERENDILERKKETEISEKKQSPKTEKSSKMDTPQRLVAIDMPMTPESVAIYLGIIQAGMAVVSIADSFSSQQIALRLDPYSSPSPSNRVSLVFTQDFIYRSSNTNTNTKPIPLYQRVVDAIDSINTTNSTNTNTNTANIQCIVINGFNPNTIPNCLLRKQDLPWSIITNTDISTDINTTNSNTNISTNTTSYTKIVPSSTISNILFSSGTTGTPKAIPWSHSSPLKSGMDAYFHQDIHPGDRVCWPTNLGWMMGPWLIYASLLNNATMCLYWKSPLEEAFIDFVGEARVTMLGVVPSLVKAWKRRNICITTFNSNWKEIRTFSSTGESSNAEDYNWLRSRAGNGKAPVIEYCGGTEVAGGYLTGTVVQEQRTGLFSTPALGVRLAIGSVEGLFIDAANGTVCGAGIDNANGTVCPSELQKENTDANGTVCRCCNGTMAAANGTVCGSDDTVDNSNANGTVCGCCNGTLDAANGTICSTQSNANGTICGEISITSPSIGLSTTLLNRDHYKTYYKGMPVGHRRHGDEIERIADNGRVFFRILGRMDDSMNLGGIKTSCIDLEQACNKARGVVETAAIGYSPLSGGPSRLVVFVVLEKKSEISENSEISEISEISKSQLILQLRQLVKKHLNPLFSVSDAVVVPSLPRTASNKIMRRVLRDSYRHSLEGPVSSSSKEPST